jgi:hypothetical protein
MAIRSVIRVMIMSLRFSRELLRALARMLARKLAGVVPRKTGRRPAADFDARRRIPLTPAIVVTLLIAALAFSFGSRRVSAQEDQAAQDGMLTQEDGTPILNGYTTVMPLRHFNSAQVMSAVNSNTTVPMWSYKITSPVDGHAYPGVMVGSSPFYNGLRTTAIPTVIVPLVIHMPDGGVFDPTVLDSCSLSSTISPLAQAQASPVFTPTFFAMNGISMGTGIYSDEYQRANFYLANVSTTGNSYHTVLNPLTVSTPQVMQVPTNEGVTYAEGCGGKFGVIDLTTFDNLINSTIIPGLAAQGVSPTSFPIFILHDVVMGDPGTSQSTNCCVLGYHGAAGSPVQTYGVADLDSTGVFRNAFPDVSDLSHEVIEWMDDPIGTNPTPAWGHVGQVGGCQNNLEVADPLTDTNLPGITMPNGLVYHPQEIAYFSWFLRQSPNLGAGGKYSDNGTFTTNAGAVCQGTITD